MAQFIPPLGETALKNMATAGERRVAKFLQKHLNDDCLVWYNIPMGNKRLYADFIILMPDKGLLCLEVKDWKIFNLTELNRDKWKMLIEGSLKQIVRKAPLEQARSYIHNIVNLLKKDDHLQQSEGNYIGNLRFPYAYGAVFTGFSYQDICQRIDADSLNAVLPRHLALYKDDLQEKSQQAALKRLHGMFTYPFPCSLGKEEIDLIRWYLFPEIRINHLKQLSLLDSMDSIQVAQPSKPITVTAGMIKIMDVQQEQLARSMGSGHRVIHGVAGSGKTLILTVRAAYLAEQSDKPVLVLCYNIALAAKLRSVMADKGVADRVQVHTFHGWCSTLVQDHGVTLLPEERKLPYYKGAELAAIRAIKENRIPAAQYGAVLIDEGHDFHADWLRAAVSMADENLLLLYDDAQAIYQSGSRLGFSLKSVGIKAQGRTNILRLNYRNTKEIIGFAYLFSQSQIIPRDGGEDGIPLLEPEAAGDHGLSPYVRACASWQEELAFLSERLDKWAAEAYPLKNIAVLCHTAAHCDDVCSLLKSKKIKYQSLQTRAMRRKYRADREAVTVCTMHSSKGLEFERVMLMGVGYLKDKTAEDQTESIRLLYVAMTRAQAYLMVTVSGDSGIAARLLETYRQWRDLESASPAES